MKRLVWLLVLPLTLLFVVFAVANRHIVTLSFDPTPIIIEAPLYSIILASVFIGILVGGFIAWLKGVRCRSRTRKKQAMPRREVEFRRTSKSGNKSRNDAAEIIKAA